MILSFGKRGKDLILQIEMKDSLKQKIDSGKLPSHIALIMDGNGRWAKSKGMPRLYGHKAGVNTVKKITEAAAELGIQYLSLYAFSTENWSRPALEVTGLMNLLVESIRNELDTLNKNGIRLLSIGNLDGLPSKTRDVLLEALENTKSNHRLNLVLALNYSARWEILSAARSLVQLSQTGKLNGEITETDFSNLLSTAGIPDPELLIRTSGEQRISNFLLWQLAYSELYFTPVHWPEFNEEHFYTAILDYQGRQRRFGLISEQL